MTKQKKKPEEENQAKTAGTGNNEAAHLKTFQVDDFGNEEGTDGFTTIDENGNVIDDDAPDDESGHISKDAFYTIFQTIFAMPGMFVPDFQPLAIQDDEQQAGRAASDAIYGLLEIYYPEGLVPGGDTLAHLIVAGPFIAGKVIIVREILKARQATSADQVAQPQEQEQSQDQEVQQDGG